MDIGAQQEIHFFCTFLTKWKAMVSGMCESALYAHFAPPESKIHRAIEDKSSLEIQNDEMLSSEM